MDELTNQGIEALKTGDRARARYLLRTALEKDLDNLQAWIWLSGAVELDDEKLECLQQVMRIDPGNPTAARGIARLTGREVTDVLADSAAAAVAAATAPVALVNSPPGSALAGDTADSMVGEQAVFVAPGTVQEGEVAGALQESPGGEPAVVLTPDETISSAPEAAPFTGMDADHQLQDLEKAGEPVFRARPSLLSTLLLMFFTPILLFVILLVALPQLSGDQFVLPAIMLVIVAVVVFFIWRAISLLSTRYIVTTAAIIIARGPFKRTRQAIPLQAVRQVTCQRNIFQRLAGTGSILITTNNGDSEKPLKLSDVAKCAQRAQQIEKIISGGN